MNRPDADASEGDETRDFWNRVAGDWRVQVGTRGDTNRILNSDPVLWAFAGDVSGLTVLDAGCGTGYLSKALHDRGAHVTGVDFSENMIAIARAEYPALDFRVDSCSELRTIPDSHFDLLIANYVLMDIPDLHGAIRAFRRVLKASGIAVLVFSHPLRGGCATFLLMTQPPLLAVMQGGESPAYRFCTISDT